MPDEPAKGERYEWLLYFCIIADLFQRNPTGTSLFSKAWPAFSTSWLAVATAARISLLRYLAGLEGRCRERCYGEQIWAGRFHLGDDK